MVRGEGRMEPALVTPMKRKTLTITRWVLAGMASATTWVSQAQPHWPQFRGPNGQGVLETAAPPVHFHASSNLVWSAAIPSGDSSPCIWGHPSGVFVETVCGRARSGFGGGAAPSTEMSE